MTTTVIGLFEDAGIVRKINDELVDAGCSQADLIVFGAHQGDVAVAEKVEEELLEREFDEQQARSYAENVRAGKILIAARIDDELSDTATAIMERYEASDREDANESSRADAGGRGQHSEQEQTTPVIEEELKVGKRQNTASVRAQRVVSERPVEQTVSLRQENVDVDRRPADRKLSAAEQEQAFKETAIEMPETKEEAVVSKEARVVGEVTLRKGEEEEQQTVKDSVRRADVEVDKSEGKPARKR